MSDGWRCPECGLILAPSLLEHRCDPPAASSPVTAVAPFAPAGSGFSAAAFPADVTITTTNSGDVALSSAQIRQLVGEVQRALLRQARRRGSAA